MNILHISPYVPDVHANHAGGVCMGKQVETLKKYNNVTVLTFVNNDYEKELIKKHPDYYYIETNTISFMKNALLHLNMPNMFAIRNSKQYRELLIRLVKEKNIDAIHAEFTAMGQFIWIKEMFPNIQFNLVEHDVTIQSYRRQMDEAKGLKHIYCTFEYNKVKKSEALYLSKADHVMTFNQKDGNLLKEIYQCNDVEILNPYYGIDFSEEKETKKISNSICFVGQMGRNENHVAAMRLIKIFEDLNQKDWKLNIIGAYPKQELLDKESANIHITGFVDDINEEIRKNQIAVFPLTYGAGIKLKVLLAIGLGLPVVTTAIGAEGIDEEGQVLHLAESDEEIADKIKELLTNQNLLNQSSEKGIAFVKDKFTWEKTEIIFKELYQ